MQKHSPRHFMDFEQPVKELYEQIAFTKQQITKYSSVDFTSSVQHLQQLMIEKRREITKALTPWQKVQLSRHPDRPYALQYIQQMATDFLELFGDRKGGDDKAIVGGFAKLNGETVMIIGHQKSHDTLTRLYRNFGMAKPSGYRKALRLMKLAEKFNKPVITLIDTPGAYPGLESQLEGGGEAIGRCIYEMMRLEVPVICVIIGEGGSGGALAIGAGDTVLMLENTWYSVVSPESCSAILWRSLDKKETAAEQLRLTATDMKNFGLIDGIVPEPAGGAHWDEVQAAGFVKKNIITSLNEMKQLTPQERINRRIEKFSRMGFWDEQ